MNSVFNWKVLSGICCFEDILLVTSFRYTFHLSERLYAENIKRTNYFVSGTLQNSSKEIVGDIYKEVYVIDKIQAFLTLNDKHFIFDL